MKTAPQGQMFFLANIGVDVTDTVIYFFQGAYLSKSYTCSNFILIPKEKNTDIINDLGPVSLSNFCYKNIAKMMLNRLFAVLPKIVSKKRSDFVPSL